MSTPFRSKRGNCLQLALFAAGFFLFFSSFCALAAQGDEGGVILFQDWGGILAKKKKEKNKSIEINLSLQVLRLYEDGREVGSYLISSGKRSTPTPKGNFQIYDKVGRAWSKEYQLSMPYWMAFIPSGSYGIHELPEWPDGSKEGAAHLGIPVSHGCVRLGVGAAKKVYDWTPIGTSVIIK